MNRALVCGGRDYANVEKLYSVLDAWEPAITTLIHGGATGADAIAAQWARERGIPQQAYLADWKTYGRSAGPRRNQQMLDEGTPDVIFAFPTQSSRGTWDMVARAQKARVLVVMFGGSSDKEWKPRIRRSIQT